MQYFLTKPCLLRSAHVCIIYVHIVLQCCLNRRGHKIIEFRSSTFWTIWKIKRQILANYCDSTGNWNFVRELMHFMSIQQSFTLHYSAQNGVWSEKNWKSRHLIGPLVGEKIKKSPGQKTREIKYVLNQFHEKKFQYFIFRFYCDFVVKQLLMNFIKPLMEHFTIILNQKFVPWYIFPKWKLAKNLSIIRCPIIRNCQFVAFALNVSVLYTSQ